MIENQDKYGALVLALAVMDGTADGYTEAEKHDAKKTIDAMLLELIDSMGKKSNV